MLPRLQAVLSAIGYHRVPSTLPSLDETFHGYRIPGEPLALLLSHRPESPDLGDPSACSEKASVATRPTPTRSTPSTAGHRESGREWQTCSMERLHFILSQASANRPRYTTEVQNEKLKRPIGNYPETKPNLDGISGESSKDKARREHAEVERARRERHRAGLVDSYSRLSDSTLQEAGWKPNFTKAPTKEKIVTAMNIHESMLRRLIMLEQQGSAQKDVTIEGLIRENQLLRDTQELRFPPGAHQCIDQSMHRNSQSHLAFRTVAEGRYHENEVREWSSSASSTTRYVSSTSPARSLSSLTGSFHSSDSGPTKRKRGENHDETTPTGPSRQGLVTPSLDSSPRSATSSRSSWCFVEK